jgi:DNA-binding NtrC family response regulator
MLREFDDAPPVQAVDASPDTYRDEQTISPAMKNLYGLVKKVARSSVNVLVLGESGVGKERIAKQIHQLGPRQKCPFVVVDCGATPAGLLESELFGHVKGSFTHAVSDKKGLIETADTGTLFLDEIGNITHEMQIRLLRFIEDRTIRRIGGLKGKPVDCRIIAATNADLGEAIKAGDFREDLFFRLRVVTLTIPPLRERKADIPMLVDHFAREYCRQQCVEPTTIPEETMDWLCEYSWPGNVRELKNAIEGGIVLCRDNILRSEDFHLAGITGAYEQSTTDDNCLSLEESEKTPSSEPWNRPVEFRKKLLKCWVSAGGPFTIKSKNTVSMPAASRPGTSPGPYEPVIGKLARRSFIDPACNRIHPPVSLVM